MKWTDWDEALMALTMWREARHEQHDGMRAVGHVIMNRSVAWNRSVAEICTQHAQFSSMTFPGDLQLIVFPLAHDPNFEDAMQVAELIMGGHDDDNTGGAIYYANLDTMDKGGWFDRHIVTGKRRICTIGRHTFFSDENVASADAQA